MFYPKDLASSAQCFRFFSEKMFDFEPESRSSTEILKTDVYNIFERLSEVNKHSNWNVVSNIIR